MVTKAVQIKISRKTHIDLSKVGVFGDSYDSIVRKLLESYKAASGLVPEKNSQTAAAPLSHKGESG